MVTVGQKEGARPRAMAPQADADNGYDPLHDLLRAQNVRPAHLAEINLRALTPFQRALLVIDGTVTKFIEAYTMEPVDVRRVGQEKQALPADHPWLEAGAGTPVLARQVLLTGKYSRVLYAYAVSLVVPERLTGELQAKLDVDGESLGRILLSGRLETYRDILWYGAEQGACLPPLLHELAGDLFLSRTYRIIARGCPVMVINEKFPLNADRSPLWD